MNRSRILVLCLGMLGTPNLALPEASMPTLATPARLHTIAPQTPQELRSLFQHTDEPLGFVSAHRGGPEQGFPENCIATFENTLRHTFAVMEIDPRYAKDGSIVLHHDPRLERTTTGQGPVVEKSLAELKRLRLKDPGGAVTEFQIPTLDEVLEWARGKTILILDQKDVPAAVRVRKIEEHNAEAYAMVIVYSFKDAQACHLMNSNIMMEVMVPDRPKFAEFEKTGVPWSNIVAFVGHTPPQDSTIFQLLHDKGTSCIVGSSRNLDRRLLEQPVMRIKSLEPDYRALLQRGADLIETDIPKQVGPLLYGDAPVSGSKMKFFLRK